MGKETRKINKNGFQVNAEITVIQNYIHLFWFITIPIGKSYTLYIPHSDEYFPLYGIFAAGRKRKEMHMTLKEFYAAVGGDYDATLNRIPKESMVLRFVKKYADDKTYAQLTEAVKAQDWETAFRASHTLKGVAQNLGFDGLYRAAFALTEEMRGGKPLTDTALYDAVAQQQQIVLDAVRQLA